MRFWISPDYLRDISHYTIGYSHYIFSVHCTLYILGILYYIIFNLLFYWGGGGGGPTPFLPMEKCVFSHFFPWGKMGKKVHGKRGKWILFPFFPYTFFSHSPPPPLLYFCPRWIFTMARTKALELYRNIWYRWNVKYYDIS